MRFQRRRGVSVIIATLLLVAISVSAAIIVYVFVGGLAGSLLNNGAGESTTEHLELTSYTFAITPGSCACSQQVLEMFLQNTGAGTTIVSTVYYDGVLMPVTAAPTNPATAISNAVSFVIPSSTTMISSGSQELAFSSAAGQQTYPAQAVGQIVITFNSGNAAAFGGSHTIKVVSTTGATNVFIVVSGKAG